MQFSAPVGHPKPTCAHDICRQLLEEEQRYPDCPTGMDAATQMLLKMIASKNREDEEFVFFV